MTTYHRNFTAGGSFFFTVNLAELGMYPEDWAGDVGDYGEPFGERPP
jgi:hypothetical protein